MNSINITAILYQWVFKLRQRRQNPNSSFLGQIVDRFVRWARAATSELRDALRTPACPSRHPSASRFRLSSVPPSPIPVTIDTSPQMDKIRPSLHPSLRPFIHGSPSSSAVAASTHRLALTAVPAPYSSRRSQPLSSRVPVRGSHGVRKGLLLFIGHFSYVLLLLSPRLSALYLTVCLSHISPKYRTSPRDHHSPILLTRAWCTCI